MGINEALHTKRYKCEKCGKPISWMQNLVLDHHDLCKPCRKKLDKYINEWFSL